MGVRAVVTYVLVKLLEQYGLPPAVRAFPLESAAQLARSN